LKESSEMLSPIPNTPEERPSLPLMSFMPSRDKAEPSMVSEVDRQLIYLFYFESLNIFNETFFFEEFIVKSFQKGKKYLCFLNF